MVVCAMYLCTGKTSLLVCLQKYCHICEFDMLLVTYRVYHNYLDWAKYQNRHCSKSIWVMKLIFCQNDCPIRGSFWQKISFITNILFEQCLFWFLAQSRLLWDTLYFNYIPTMQFCECRFSYHIFVKFQEAEINLKSSQ